MALQEAKNINEYMFNEGYISFPQPLGCINTLIEWEKWLSYQSEHETKRRQEIKSKTIGQISLEELKELKKYKDRVVMAKLFKKYNEKKCSYSEYKTIASFMENSIEEYMINILNEEELKEAKEKIEELSNVSSYELRKKVNQEQQIENYNKLSMVDAYVLHVISSLSYNKSMDELNKTINNAFEHNKVMQKMNHAS